MLEKLKNIRIINERDYAAIGIVLEEPIRYDVLLLHKEKDDLAISKSFSTTEFTEIKKEIPKGTPVVLNFSGKGVINKMVGTNGDYLKEVLFSAKPEDFHIYRVSQGIQNFVSICRKDIVSRYITQLKEAKYHPMDYSIGPFVARVCAGIIEESVFRVQNGELSFSDGMLMGYRGASGNTDVKRYKVGGEWMKGGDVVLLSSVLNSLYPSDDIDYAKELLLGSRKEYKRKRIFDLFAVVSLITFLLALLGSYLLLMYFNKEYVKYEEQLYHLNDNYAQIKKMEEELANKQSIVENSGIYKRRFLSFYINELTVSTPDGVLLNSLKINPLNKKMKMDEPISLHSNTVLIDGETSNSFFVNQWVKQIKDFEWVGKIEILNLNRADNETETFSLKIIIR